jgi:hypothetical protein
MTKAMEKAFNAWKKNGNVSFNGIYYSTQDAMYMNKLSSLDELKKYFLKEFYNI